MTIIMTVIINIQKFKNLKILNNFILINGIYLLDYHWNIWSRLGFDLDWYDFNMTVIDDNYYDR